MKGRVLEYLLTIPKGKVVTYGQIAAHLGNRKLARAVGNALHTNPDPDRYPCYKVVNTQGKLATNFAFGGIEGQKQRLEADGIQVNNGKVDLAKYQWSPPRIYLAASVLDGRSGHEVGRSLLSQLYAAYVGGELPLILTEPMGKPYFASSNWHFSISHTKKQAFCVLADVPVGIDAEQLDRDIRLELAPKILSDDELVQFEAATDKRRALLTFWVLKEAHSKLTGQGMKWHPTHTNFSLADSRVTEIDGCLVAIMH